MKEFIEIPFGAKDSELCGWEYTIPEGFVASIENGKIIVKKEDTDDEKIRKEITELVMQPTWKTEKEFHRRKELCAWLEKQGEHKPTWSEEDISNIDHLLNALCGVIELKQFQIDKLIKWLKSLKERLKGE